MPKNILYKIIFFQKNMLRFNYLKIFMAIKRQKTSAEEFQKLREKWLDFLMFTNFSVQNKSLLFEYYANEFAYTPRRFYNFVHLLYSYLRTARNDESKKVIAQKYVDILSPLCQKFGFYEEKKLLDNFSFKLLYPAEYEKINKQLINYKRKSKTVIDEINTKFKKLLKKHHFYRLEVTGRYKTTYSIAQKLKLKQREKIQGLGDVFAFRIIVKDNSIENCFQITNLLHNEFYPLPNRFKDYISIPKINGYQSLHTGLKEVNPKLDLPIEVQIRTKTMDDFAEKGIAAHWLYSKSKLSRILTEKEKKLVKHFYDSQEKTYVYFFSYKGDLYKLQKGASVLDFAYRIHTNLGDKIKTVLVNDKLQPIDYEIQEGDKIKILTAEKKQVTKDWLKYNIDKHTRKHILHATRNF